ncbi:MAG: SMC-Scp complex subunit ScpB [Candidatus Paceibacterota bacterium]|jgi:segregation and condensation protein B
MLQKLVTILFLSGDPLPLSTIASIIGSSQLEIEPQLEELDRALTAIGLSLLRSNEGLSIVTQPNQAKLVEEFWKEELKGELTPAALQVLTLVAYLGNPTREQISYIRGVQSSQSIRTLTVRGLISRNGEVCTLTGDALKHLGVTKPEDLPDYEAIYKNLSEKLAFRES